MIEFVANESKHVLMFFDRAVISSATRTHPLQSLTEVSARLMRDKVTINFFRISDII